MHVPLMEQSLHSAICRAVGKDHRFLKEEISRFSDISSLINLKTVHNKSSLREIIESSYFNFLRSLILCSYKKKNIAP